MKKFFLKNQKYTKVTKRIFTVISILPAIIAFIIVAIIEPLDGFLDFLAWILIGIIFCAINALIVWGIYFVIRWILKALPDERP